MYHQLKAQCPVCGEENQAIVRKYFEYKPVPKHSNLTPGSREVISEAYKLECTRCGKGWNLVQRPPTR